MLSVGLGVVLALLEWNFQRSWADLAHRGEERFEIDRLAQKSSGREFGRLLATQWHRGKNEHRDVRESCVGKLRRPELPAVHDRHHEVKEDEGGPHSTFEKV